MFFEAAATALRRLDLDVLRLGALGRRLGVLCDMPCTVVAVIAGEIADDAIAFEDKDVAYDVVQEVSVVADDDSATIELGEVLLEYAQGDNIEVVGGFVQYQEVGTSHQHGGKVQTAQLAAAKGFGVLLLGGDVKEKALEQLRGVEP